MDEWKRFANAAVQEELIAQTEALRAKYSFDKPEGSSRKTREGRAGAARDPGALEAGGRSAARAGAGALAPLPAGRRPDPGQGARVLRAARRGAQGQPRAKIALIERAEALADSTDWIKTAEELKKLQAEWQAIGAVPRQDTRVDLEAVPRRVRRFFTRRNADLAQRKEIWSANLAQQGSAVRAGRGARRLDATGTSAASRDAAAAGRVEDDRSRAPQQVRSDLAALPRGLRHVLRPLQAARPDRARSRSRRTAKRWSRSSKRCRTHAEGADGGEPAADLLERVRSLRTRWNQSTPVVRQGADPLSARFMDALERADRRRTRSAFRGTELDIDANRQRMEKLFAKVEGFLTEAGRAGEFVAGARHDAARSAGVEHDRRPRG